MPMQCVPRLPAARRSEASPDGRRTQARPDLNIAVCIQHHANRAYLIPELVTALAGFDDVLVITDVDGELDTWRAHRACLEALPGDASHLLVVQDDAVPCEGFAEKTLGVVFAKPDDLVCLFAPGFGFIRRRMLEAKRAREAFAPLPQTAFVPLVAVVYPRVIVERLLAWVDGDRWPAASARALRGSDDGIVAQFCRSSRLRAWMTVPSLCDHRADVPSIIRPSHQVGAHRRAALL